MRRSTAMFIMLCSTGVSVCMNFKQGNARETTKLIDFSKLPLNKSYGTTFERAMQQAPDDATRMLLKESALSDLRRRKAAPVWERDPYFFRVYQLKQFQFEFERLCEQASTLSDRLSVVRWAHTDLERRLSNTKLTPEDREIISAIDQKIERMAQELNATSSSSAGTRFWCSCGCHKQKDYDQL